MRCMTAWPRTQEPRVHAHAPSDLHSHSAACRFKETGNLLSWLPPVDGADSHAAAPARRQGRRHVAPPGAHASVLNSFLHHHEYPPAPKPRHTRSRISVKVGGSDEPALLDTRSRSRARGGALATGGRARKSSPGKVSVKEAAMLLPPIHGRPQLPSHEAPSWGVKDSRPPFKGR